MNEKRRRKTKNSMRRRSLNPVIIFILIILLFILLWLKDLSRQLEDVKSILEKTEIPTRTEERVSAEIMDVMIENVDYVGSIETLDVEKPVERSETEVLQRLKEFGKTNSTIKEISDNSSLYPKEMLAALANNPEMTDFVAGYLNAETDTAEELTDTEREQEFPLLLQWDPRWGYKPYGNGSVIGLAGCGPTCMSMVLLYLTKDSSLTPGRIASYSMQNGYYVDSVGTAWALMEDVPKLYNVKVSTPTFSESGMKGVLDNGSVIICAMRKGDFSSSGHFIVIYGYDRDGFKINDPNCIARSERRWTFEELKWQIKNLWAYT